MNKQVKDIIVTLQTMVNDYDDETEPFDINYGEYEITYEQIVELLRFIRKLLQGENKNE